MFKAAFIFTLLLAAPCAPAAAPGPQKVLLVIRDYDNSLRFNMAVWRAVQLRRRGAEVSVLFENEAVLNFLPPQAGVMARSGANAARAALPANRGGNRAMYGPERGRELLKELLRLKVPLTLCSFSAVALDKYAELKAAGLKLTPHPDAWTDLGAYRRAGARVLIF